MNRNCQFIKLRKEYDKLTNFKKSLVAQKIGRKKCRTPQNLQHYIIIEKVYYIEMQVCILR